MSLFLFFILKFIFLIQGMTILSASDDYFNRITMVSDGRITRFTQNPISVYISPLPVAKELQNAYMQDIEYALEQWTGCSEGQLQFKQVNSEEANIRIYWTSESLSGESDPLGEASLVRFDSGGYYVKVSIILKERHTLSSSVHRELKSVIMHEIGHAIGLWGHSQDTNDIMYPQTNAIYPTRRDKNTLLRLLAIPNNTQFYETAIAELKSDILISQDKSYLHFWLGSVYADKGEYDLAIKELFTALKLSPNLVKTANRLGRIFQSEGMYDKAIDFYFKEASLDPSPGIFAIIGILNMRQEKYDVAVDSFKRAISLDSKFKAARTNLLASYHLWISQLIKTDNANKAITILKEALEIFPSSRVLIYDMGTAYDKAGQYNEAIDEYKKVLEVDPSFEAAKEDIANCINNLSAEQIKSGNLEKSIELCEQSLKWAPDFWEARKNLEFATIELGKRKYELGLLDEAMTNYNAALKTNPKSVEAYNGLGFVFYEMGIYKDSLKNFQTALEIDPNSEDAKLGIMASKKKINISRAKLAILPILSSMIICLSAIFAWQQRKDKRSPKN